MKKSVIAIALGIAAASLITTTTYAAIKKHTASHLIPLAQHARSAPTAPAASIAKVAPAAKITQAEQDDDFFDSFMQAAEGSSALIARPVVRARSGLASSSTRHKHARQGTITTVASIHHVANKPVAPAAK